MKRILIIPLMSLFIFLISGCNDKKSVIIEDEVNISCFKSYVKIVTNSEAIVVKFNDEYVGEFTIDDNEIINKIKGLINDANYTHVDLISPGTSRTLEFVNNGENIIINSRYIKFDNKYYSSSNGREIDIILYNYAINNNLVNKK